MFERWRRWRDRRYVDRNAIPEDTWGVTRDLVVLRHLDRAERARLRELATLLLRDKSFYGAHDFLVTDAMRVRIAAEACVLLLHLERGRFDDFDSVVIYESSFVAQRSETDDIGVVHQVETELLGESWERGPLLLSWADIEAPQHEAANVVLHEFAHKLDGLDGELDGRPPLRRGMRGADWQHAFQAAFDDLCARLDACADGEEPDSDIDAYGAEAPEEFFAVCIETFFMAPQRLQRQYPAVYAQLSQWLNQDPMRGPQRTPPPRRDRNNSKGNCV